MHTEDRDTTPGRPGLTPGPGRPSSAFRAGQIVQAIVLAVAVAAIVVKLLRADLDLSFRYGGF